MSTLVGDVGVTPFMTGQTPTYPDVGSVPYSGPISVYGSISNPPFVDPLYLPDNKDAAIIRAGYCARSKRGDRTACTDPETGIVTRTGEATKTPVAPIVLIAGGLALLALWRLL